MTSKSIAVAAWMMLAILTASDAGESQRHVPDASSEHTATAFDDGVRVVGAPTKADGSIANVGAASIYGLDSGTWALKQKLTPPTGQAMRFGESVALSGDLLAVAAPARAERHLAWAGVVYVYARDQSLPASMQWQPLETPMLTAGSDAQVDGFFGGPQDGGHQGIAMDCNFLIVGAPGMNVDNVVSAGKVYIFLFDREAKAWSLEGTLISSSPEARAGFGRSVAISGARVSVAEFGGRKRQVFSRDATTREWHLEAEQNGGANEGRGR